MAERSQHIHILPELIFQKKLTWNVVYTVVKGEGGVRPLDSNLALMLTHCTNVENSLDLSVPQLIHL